MNISPRKGGGGGSKYFRPCRKNKRIIAHIVLFCDFDPHPGSYPVFFSRGVLQMIFIGGGVTKKVLKTNKNVFIAIHWCTMKDSARVSFFYKEGWVNIEKSSSAYMWSKKTIYIFLRYAEISQICLLLMTLILKSPHSSD